MIDPGPQFEYYAELGHEISREIPIYRDRDDRLEAFANIFRLPGGEEMLMFHIRLFAPMSPRMYKDFVRAIPAMERQFAATGRPIFTFFDVDSDIQGKFAKRLGWKEIASIDMYDRYNRRIYIYDKHLRPKE